MLIVVHVIRFVKFRTAEREKIISTVLNFTKYTVFQFMILITKNILHLIIIFKINVQKDAQAECLSQDGVIMSEGTNGTLVTEIVSVLGLNQSDYNRVGSFALKKVQYEIN